MSNTNTSKTPVQKRILAIICIVILGIMILATLLTAFLDSSGVWFRGCLMLTIAVPILSWVCIWLYGVMNNKHSLASVDLLKDESIPSDEAK